MIVGMAVGWFFTTGGAGSDWVRIWMPKKFVVTSSAMLITMLLRATSQPDSQRGTWCYVAFAGRETLMMWVLN